MIPALDRGIMTYLPSKHGRETGPSRPEEPPNKFRASKATRALDLRSLGTSPALRPLQKLPPSWVKSRFLSRITVIFAINSIDGN